MTDRRIIRGLEEAVRHSRGEIEATTHRVTVLDYPARHIVIGPRAMPEGPRSRSKLSHFVATLRASIAIAVEFLGSDRGFTFYLGFYAGCMATVGLALLWARVLS